MKSRASNDFYGSAKAGFTACLSWLRNRLARKGVHVVTVLPEFVAHKMSAGIILLATKKLSDVTFTWLDWRVIVFGIRSIPQTILKATTLQQTYSRTS